MAAYLETCIKEVIGKEPDLPAVEVQKLISNIKTQILDEGMVTHIKQLLVDLPRERVEHALVRFRIGLETLLQHPDDR